MQPMPRGSSSTDQIFTRWLWLIFLVAEFQSFCFAAVRRPPKHLLAPQVFKFLKTPINAIRKMSELTTHTFRFHAKPCGHASFRSACVGIGVAGVAGVTSHQGEGRLLRARDRLRGLCGRLPRGCPGKKKSHRTDPRQLLGGGDPFYPPTGGGCCRPRERPRWSSPSV